jgi:hypothetical protein
MSSEVVPSSPALTARADANCWERLWQFDTLGFHDDVRSNCFVASASGLFSPQLSVLSRD